MTVVDLVTPSLHFEKGLPGEATEEGQAAALADGGAREAALQRIREKAQEIRSNRGLNDEGRREALRAWREGPEGRRAYATILGDGKAPALEEQAEAEWGRLADPNVAFKVENAGTPERMGADRRVVDWARSKTKARDPVALHEVRAMLLADVEAGRMDRVRALALYHQEMGDVDPLLPDDAMREILEARVSTRWPERWGRIRDRRRTAALIRRNQHSARSALAEIGAAGPSGESFSILGGEG